MIRQDFTANLDANGEFPYEVIDSPDVFVVFVDILDMFFLFFHTDEAKSFIDKMTKKFGESKVRVIEGHMTSVSSKI